MKCSRKSIAPGSLCIRVDGIDRGVLDATSLFCDLILEEGASIVRLVATDEDLEPVTFAAYVLMYDAPKAEHWEVDLGELGLLDVTFDYREDETVEATFNIRSAAQQQDHASSTPKTLAYAMGVGGTGLHIVRRLLHQIELLDLRAKYYAALRLLNEVSIVTQDDVGVRQAGDPNIVTDSETRGFHNDLTFALHDGTQMICRFMPCLGLPYGFSAQEPVTVYVVGSLAGGTGAGCLTFIGDLIRSLESTGKPLVVLDRQHRLSALRQLPQGSTAVALALRSSSEQSNRLPKVFLDLPAGCGKSYAAAWLVHELQSSLVCAVPGKDVEDLIAGLCDRRIGLSAINDTQFSAQINSDSEVVSINNPEKGDPKEMNNDTLLREVMLAAQSGARSILRGRAYLADDIVADTLFQWSKAVAEGRAPRDHKAWSFIVAKNQAMRMRRVSPVADQPSRHPVEILVDTSASMSPIQRAVDRHVAGEACALEEFAGMAHRRGIPLEPLPRIVQTEQVLSHVFALAAILMVVLDFFAATVSLQNLGLWSSGIALMVGIGAALCIKAWWAFGWSKRLFRKYYTAGRAIELLTQSASGGRTDWRGVARVQRLAWHLSTLRYGTENQGCIQPFDRALNRAPSDFLVSALTEAGERRALKIANAVVAERPIVSSSHLAKVVAESLEMPAPVVNALVCSTRPWRVAGRR